MDSPTIQQLRTEWHALGTAPASSIACCRLAACEPAIADLNVNNLTELLITLLPTTGRLSRIDEAAAITAMLRSAGVDVLIPRAIIQALIPGILGLHRRIDVASGPWCNLDTFLADAISALWELTMSWSGTDRPYAAGDLLSAVHTRLRTLHRSERRHRSHLADTPDTLELLPATTGRTGEELLAVALTEATDCGMKTVDAAALYSTRVLGIPLNEVAGLTGMSVAHLRYRRRKAIAQLVA